MFFKSREKTRVSRAYRTIEVALGVTALTVGLLAIAYPMVFVVSLVKVLGIALMVTGFLRLSTAASKEYSRTSRATNAGIGMAAVIIASITLVFPMFATETLAVLIGIGLLIYGFGRMVIGGAVRRLSGFMRVFLVLTSILAVVFSLIVIFFPVVGIYSSAFFISIVFLLIGADSLVSGIIGSPL